MSEKDLRMGEIEQSKAMEYGSRKASPDVLKLRHIQSDTKKRKLLKNPPKIEEIQEKKLLTEIEPLQLSF